LLEEFGPYFLQSNQNLSKSKYSQTISCPGEGRVSLSESSVTSNFQLQLQNASYSNFTTISKFSKWDVLVGLLDALTGRHAGQAIFQETSIFSLVFRSLKEKRKKNLFNANIDVVNFGTRIKYNIDREICNVKFGHTLDWGPFLANLNVTLCWCAPSGGGCIWFLWQQTCRVQGHSSL
jgi:hypothetical protein